MKIVIKNLGYLLIISSLFRLIPIISAIIYKEEFFLFLISFFVSLALGIIFASVKTDKEKENLMSGTLLVVLSFALISLLGSISYLKLFGWNFTNALFESVSGFTTTGLTMINDLSIVPKSLLLWRSTTQWIGGLGIISVFLYIVHMLKFEKDIKSYQIKAKSLSTLYHAQSEISQSDMSISSAIKSAVIIYGSYTIGGIILLWIFGLGLFESMAIAFTSLSTGGFSVANDFYSSLAIQVLIIIFMVMGSLPLAFHQNLFRLKIKKMLSSMEMRLLLLISSILIAGSTYFSKTEIIDTIFNIVSAITTTGFSASKISATVPLFFSCILFAMFVGGSIGSTAGGIKLKRFWTIIKALPWSIKKMSSPPAAIIPLKVCDNSIDNESLIITLIFTISYISILVTGFFILVCNGFDITASIFQIMSALGTVGLQTVSLNSASLVSKITLMFAMFLGRLEIIPAVIVIYKLVKRG